MKNIALAMIKGYKICISPLLGNHCRFSPSCSVYTYEAIEKYGLLKGAYLGVKRLLKCHPFRPGGVDLVP